MKHRLPLCVTAIVLAALLTTAGGCTDSRNAQTREELLELRDRNDAKFATDARSMLDRVAAHAKGEIGKAPAGTPAVLDLLIISGGGDWGAFGAGVLKGWGRVPAGEMARPEFDIVTGVSTGALIAPFAFLGTESDYDRVLRLYRNPQKDWVKPRGLLYFLPNNLSFAEVPGLEREMQESIDEPTLRRIVDASNTGRALLVNTTNIDEAGMRVWNIGDEGKGALDKKEIDRIHRILLASAGIPGAFPAHVIDNELYVDGGVTGNILYGTRLREEDSLPAVWSRLYPGVPQPKIRYWVIFNNKLRPTPQVTELSWLPIVTRSIETSTRFATVTAMRHLFAMTEISRLKRQANIEVRLMSVPDDWEPPKPGVFIKETMNNLADMGEKMGADPKSWRTELP